MFGKVLGISILIVNTGFVGANIGANHIWWGTWFSVVGALAGVIVILGAKDTKHS